jgi:hypothetical protein
MLLKAKQMDLIKYQLFHLIDELEEMNVLLIKKFWVPSGPWGSKFPILYYWQLALGNTRGGEPPEGVLFRHPGGGGSFWLAPGVVVVFGSHPEGVGSNTTGYQPHMYGPV